MFSKPRFNRKAIGILAVACGSICLVAAAAWAFHSYRITSSGVRVSGRITQLVERSDEHGEFYYPVFEFTDKKGVSHTIYSGTGSYPPPHRVGDAVRVLYVPGAEADAQLDDWAEIWGIPALLGALGVVYLPAGIVMCLWPRIVLRWRSNTAMRK